MLKYNSTTLKKVKVPDRKGTVPVPYLERTKSVGTIFLSGTVPAYPGANLTLPTYLRVPVPLPSILTLSPTCGALHRGVSSVGNWKDII